MHFLQSPLFWELGGWLAFLLVGGLLIKGDFQSQLSVKQQTGLLLSLVGLLFFKRLLILFINWQLNPDESQLLAQAITLRHHPVYWKYVDGATMGPLSSYYVALPGYFGIPLNYVLLRWSAFFCLLVSVVSGYYTIENFFNARVARLALLPGVAFLSFTTHFDFLHATNEQLSLALIGLAGWQYARLWRQQLFQSVGNMFLLSFISSLVPFAKLQGTPTVLVLVLAAFIGLVRHYSKMTRPVFWRALGGLIVGGVAFPSLVVLLAMGFGLVDDFVHFYITANFAYSAEASFWYFLGKFPAFVGRTTDFLVFLIPTTVLIISWLIVRPHQENRKSGLLIFSSALLIASGYAVIKPGNEFTHYLLYLVFPVCLLNAWLLNQFRSPFQTALWVSLIILSIGINAVIQPNKSTNDSLQTYCTIPFAYRHFYLSETAQATLKLARPGEDLVVWGWAPQYNVQTQMPQGVCDNHTIRLVMGSDQRVHRARYLRNIQASRPPVFIDAVGPNSSWLNDRSTYGYEQFPELKRFIDQHYRLVGEIDKNRVFARLDRYKPLITTRTHVDEKRINL